MKPYVQEAEVLRLLLSFGCTSGEKIIAWADETIVAEADIDNNLIELSTESPDKTPALLSRLSDVAMGCDKFAALRTALGRMHSLVANNSPEDLAGFATSLSKLGADYNYQFPDDLKFLKSSPEDFSLAQQGASSDLPTVSKEFLAKLKSFAAA